jgi:hypothetical protein
MWEGEVILFLMLWDMKPIFEWFDDYIETERLYIMFASCNECNQLSEI